MGFLDKFKSAFSGGALSSAPEPQGPLRLMAGDAVGWYRERFGVTGVRTLEGDGGASFQYVLRDRKGQRAVLAVCADGTMSLERVVAADVDWNADVLRDLGDDPFHLVGRAQSRVRSQGDTATGGSRAVASRRYEDSAGDRSVILEDFGGYREVRVGEAVLEPELDLVRSGQAASQHEPEACDAVETDAQGAARSAVRGSASAAALALSGEYADDPAPRRAAGRPAKSPSAAASRTDTDAEVDADPTAYDDERWADERDPSATAEHGRETDAEGIQDFAESEEDEWLAAAQYAREHPEEVR